MTIFDTLLSKIRIWNNSPDNQRHNFNYISLYVILFYFHLFIIFYLFNFFFFFFANFCFILLEKSLRLDFINYFQR